ncbi:class I SAM-dependent methyltransferase [Chitinophaga sancti]|uniref:Class I SAM-dependent methyltransferase n=1 Tax=Chitinophaga sancti TaxID=1004 RepID=A0A1K1RCP2_9BACT|nr:class I SAM-dependent methyltransferase [Chitinophaga sancti]WQD65637.1 class I SAM-dependent methyltransferase [Chitinophaga sancti]WQG88741.1 class I SAM-dependent methyltransferase [Chitinophaga sancti]SFW69935.1 Methyltransferase domain-containing protein [Chitinophaga sancti]
MEQKKMTPGEAAQQLRRPTGEDGVKMGVQMSKSNRLIYEMTLDFLHLQPGDQLLELGMGNGHFIPALFEKENNIQYTGLDISDIMVQEAITSNRDAIRAGRVQILEGTADSIPFDAAIFTKVFAVNVLYFWQPPAVTLQEICRVLQPGGELILAFRTRRTMEKLAFVDDGFTLYDTETVQQMLQNIGFRVTDIQTAVEPPKAAADGSMLVQLENVCMRGEKNLSSI